MNNQYINIAISGLGLTTSDDLKIRLRKILPTSIGINWTTIADQNISCILINEQFFENSNIQNIIQNKNIPIFIEVYTKEKDFKVIKKLNFSKS